MKSNLIPFSFLNRPTGIKWLICYVLLASTFLAAHPAQAQDWEQSLKVVVSDLSPGDNVGNSVFISESYAIIGARQENNDASGNNPVGNAGAAYIFELDGNGDWQEMQKLVASDREAFDNFGYVAISGTYAIVGAYNEDEDVSGNDSLTNAGSAYIYELDASGVWQEVQKIVPSDRDSLDQFGYRVAISGNYAIVGAYLEDEDASGNNTLVNAGSAYVFERIGIGNWQQVAKLVASDRGANDQFGVSVAISGTYAIVGAFLEDEDARGRKSLNNAGSAYIFERDAGGNWNEVSKLVAVDREATDLFGYSVSISGNTALVGARSDGHTGGGNAGSAYLFDRTGRGDWKQSQKIVASDAAPSDWFGYSVSLAGDRAIIGAISEDEDENGNNTINSAGSAYIFERNTTGSWLEVDKIVASDRGQADAFGHAVGIAGDHAVVGAVYKDDDGNPGGWINHGAAYMYHRLDACTGSSLTAEAGADGYTYFGYAPEECASLSGSASGGSGSYSYIWDNGSTGSSITVCPSTSTVYQLTVTDAAGCTATDNATVHVTDVRCKGKKVLVCHDGIATCVGESLVASHLAHGDALGECSGAYRSSGKLANGWLNIYPNPTYRILSVEFDAVDGVAGVALMDLNGRLLLQLEATDNRLVSLDLQAFTQGIYVLRISYDDGRIQNHRVVKN